MRFRAVARQLGLDIPYAINNESCMLHGISKEKTGKRKTDEHVVMTLVASVNDSMLVMKGTNLA